MPYAPRFSLTEAALKKNGEPAGRLPVGCSPSARSEAKPQTELQLAHSRIAVDVRYLPGVATGAGSRAVDTKIPRISHHHVVEYVERIHTERTLEALGNAERLGE